MSYSMPLRGALGAGMHAGTCQPSEEDCYPPGNEISRSGRSDCCCDDKYWSNLTYARIKGTQSLQYHNEQRVRRAFSLLSPSGVQDFAYDIGATPNPTLQDGIDRSVLNFTALYPLRRWVKKPCAVPSPHHCVECYSVWVPSGPASSAQAIENALVDMGFDAQSAKNAATNSNVRRMIGSEVQVIMGVPTGAADNKRSWMPSRADLLQVNDGKVFPRPWLRSFLDVFAPGWDGGIDFSKLSSSLTRLRTRPGAEPPPPPSGDERAATPPPSAEPETPWALLGGVTALAVGAVGVSWYLGSR